MAKSRILYNRLITDPLQWPRRYPVGMAGYAAPAECQQWFAMRSAGQDRGTVGGSLFRPVTKNRRAVGVPPDGLSHGDSDSRDGCCPMRRYAPAPTSQ